MMLQGDELQNVVARLNVVRGLRQHGEEKLHKLLFLLALARLYERTPDRERLVPFDDVLMETFVEVTKQFVPSAGSGSILIEYPFYHLVSDGLWSLVIRKGKEAVFRTYTDSRNMRLTHARLLETVCGGQLDESLDRCMRDPKGNAIIQAFLTERLSQSDASLAMTLATSVRDKGGHRSLFAHEAEALAAIGRHITAHRLGEMLTNVEVHDQQSNRYFEADLAVVARFGVYVVELKHWSGRIDIRPNSWLQNASFFKDDPHKANNFKAKLLRGLYDRKFPTFPAIFFQSVVVLTNPDVEAVGAAIPKTGANNPTFESIDRFLQYLKWQRESKDVKLSELQCRAFADYIRKLTTTGPPRDFLFPGYEVVERLYQFEDRAEVVARRTDLRHRKLSRLRIFFLTSEDPRARERATATLNAVQKIGEHSNILKVWDIPNENNYLVEGSDWSETGTLRDYLNRSGALAPVKAVAIVAGLARGLQAAHSQCVVHRALSPDNVLMVNDMPKLMNFDLSFQLEDNRITVIPDASKLKRSPYIAPEIYVSGTVPEATADLFSLGVILYEMLLGNRPFECSTDLERSYGRLTDEQVAKLRHIDGVSDRVVDLIRALVCQEPSDRISDAEKVLAALEKCAGEPQSAVITEVNPRLHAGVQSGLYTIESFVRAGAEAQIYRAVGVRGKPIALKLFNRDVPLNRVVDEKTYAGTVQHPSLVHVDNYNPWSDGRNYIAFDWVSDTNLRDAIEAEACPDVDSFVRGAEQLLDAIDALHGNTDDGVSSPILHNDIKPENILQGPTGRLVLIDFGAASEPHVGTYEGTEGYVAPDLRRGKDRKYCVDGDLYGLAVTLHEWLLGCRPGTEGSGSAAVPAALVQWLLKGCSPDAANRYASVSQMKEALRVALVEPQPAAPATAQVAAEERATASIEAESEQLEYVAAAPRLPEGAANPFVPYLNSLHSGSAANENALAESQARNPLFGHIHVAHPVADVIHNILAGPQKKHVVLTGHAGDGKSTIAVDIFKRLAHLPSDQPLSQSLQRREDLGAVTVVKDFSEWSPAERAGMMREILAPEGPRFLLISNTGTLLDAFKAQELAQGGDWVAVESHLLGAMDAHEPAPVTFRGAEFILINVAMMDNLAIARHIFERMLAEERWIACQSAPCREDCPIVRNVSLMQGNLPMVSDRLFLAYRRMYEYGNRLTLRQLCAHLAYTITSGLECAAIAKMAERAKPPRMAEFMFFNRFFGDDGTAPDPRAAQLRGVQVVREQGFGSQPCPTWERHLWLRSRGQSFQLKCTRGPDDFETLRRYGAGDRRDDAISGAEARKQVRRAVFFLHAFDMEESYAFLRTFLQSNMLLDFVRWQAQDGETLSLQESNSLHKRIMHVLQEHFTGVRLPEGAASDRHLFVTLSRRSHDIRQSAQVVLARYPEDDFRVILRSKASPAGGTRRDLHLEGTRSGSALSLELSLPFLDYVMLRNRGEIGKALQGSYVDRLERFKGQLIGHAARVRADDIMLVRLRTNHTFRRQIYAVRDGRLEVTDA